MHYQCEIIMPPVDDVATAIKAILAPFDENAEDSTNAFWDFYIIGGRFSGRKAEAHLDPGALEAFREWMTAEKVMVKGLQFGKQELADTFTERKVDARWRDVFPGNGDHCTLFRHSNDQYGGDEMPGDICRLYEMAKGVTASRLIIAGLKWDGDGALDAAYMTQDSFWNGVDHVDSVWDGLVTSGLAEYRAKLERATAEWRDRYEPQPDWLVATVDYHS